MLGLFFMGLQTQDFAQGKVEEVQEILRRRLETSGYPPRIVVGNELIHAAIMLPIFYEQRAFLPAWSEETGALAAVKDMVATIRSAYEEGLQPNDYHLHRIEALLSDIQTDQEKNRPPNPYRCADLDLLLTDGFLILCSHLRDGRVDPVTIDPIWSAVKKDINLADLLQKALETGQIREAIESVSPKHPVYHHMKKALATYRQIASQGGWPQIPAGPKMQLGSRDERIPLLRKRLLLSADLETEIATKVDTLDPALDQAIRSFQNRHGLEADGVVGKATLEALNVPVSQRIQQLRINMERWRWLPQDLGRRYILVNIANYELDVVEEDRMIMTMRAIVGKDYRRTPVFSDMMTYLVLAPFWHVPDKIAREDILPKIKKDPSYIKKQQIKIFERGLNGRREVDPASFDWNTMSAQDFKYQLRQDPGPNNALGSIKFMFPNKFNVYIHGTPQQELFNKTLRTFSSGCIRIERPIDLAEYLLRGNPQWTRENILTAISKWQEQTVLLPEAIPVYLLYWTAWATQEGKVHFRPDIYYRDAHLFKALCAEPPGCGG